MLIKYSVCSIFKIKLSPILKLLSQKTWQKSIEYVFDKLVRFFAEVRVKCLVVHFDAICKEVNRNVFYTFIINSSSSFLLSYSLHWILKDLSLLIFTLIMSTASIMFSKVRSFSISPYLSLNLYTGRLAFRSALAASSQNSPSAHYSPFHHIPYCRRNSFIWAFSEFRNSFSEIMHW